MRKRELVGGALVAVVAGALVIASVVGAEDGAAPATTASPAVTTTAVSPASTTSTSTSTSTSTTTTTVAPVAPTSPATAAPATAAPSDGPEPPPADPREDVAVTRIGTITIPKIGLHHELYEGVSLTVLDVGPGHWPGTPMPGGAGNVVVGGHRVTHSHPFRDLDQLAPGDEVLFDMADGSYATYRVTETVIVNPDAMWIVDPTPDDIVTLFACHPKGSAKQRIVVRAALAS
jgi:sortase A